MRLTSYTDYSLRVLIYLGLHESRLATISEISYVHRISRNHLTKLIHNLGKLGYIETMRGHGGGMKLVGRPEEMNVGQLVRQVATDFTIAECFDPNRRHDCVIASSCRLQLMLDKAVHAFLEVLDNNTLADLLQNPTRLNSLLKIETVESKAG